MPSAAIRRSGGDRAFDAFNYLVMILLSLTTLYPFFFLISSSLSALDVTLGSFSLLPRQFTLENYAKVLRNPAIGAGYVNTILRTVIGTSLSLLATFCLAWPLSKRSFPLRNLWTGLIVFTMFFSGGMIPTYLLVRQLGLIDTIWALVLPELVTAYNFVIVRNYMQTIPGSMEESAKMDGANDITILFRVILPVCKPIIATISLWVAVWHWNAWFDSMIYMTKASGQVVQLVMRRIVLEGSDQMTQMMAEMQRQGLVIAPEGLKAATIMVTTLPILCIYPFVQKYFVKGVMMGSLKG
ncbi:MAG TPA: carbohydrate ABC transporter permease [Spirochaetales bacterium]|nr:carbohydrate ABC transporter permease [Spirochaetales bacterium]HRY53569.1 carbohydrate ABC transporter permease [Spirochaetia bacterium]HRZ63389.1 carbohydrate ABC transporter permease [Spirochaetia bacterium]